MRNLYHYLSNKLEKEEKIDKIHISNNHSLLEMIYFESLNEIQLNIYEYEEYEIYIRYENENIMIIEDYRDNENILFSMNYILFDNEERIINKMIYDYLRNLFRYRYEIK